MGGYKTFCAGVIQPVPRYKKFDLEVGDIIIERIRYSSPNGRSIGKRVRGNYLYRIDHISGHVILTTRVVRDYFAPKGWKELYKEGFSKLDYLTGIIARREDDC